MCSFLFCVVFIVLVLTVFLKKRRMSDDSNSNFSFFFYSRPEVVIFSAMREFLKLFFRAQTVLGLIPFLVLVISDCVLIGFGQRTHDRKAFSCDPRLNASTEQRCYDDYSSGQFLKFYLVLMFDGMFCFIWTFIIVKTTLVLWHIKRSRRQTRNNRSEQPVNLRQPTKLMEKSCCGLCYFLTHVSLMIILLSYLYIIDSGFTVSSMYKCSLQVTDTTAIPTNQTKTDFYCKDQNLKEQVNFNIATTVIKFIIWILCLISFIYVVKTPKNKLMDKLLGDVAEGRERNLQGKTNKLTHLTIKINLLKSGKGIKSDEPCMGGRPLRLPILTCEWATFHQNNIRVYSILNGTTCNADCFSGSY